MWWLPRAAAAPANPEDIELDDAGEEEPDDAAEPQGIQLEQKAVPVSRGACVFCFCSNAWIIRCELKFTR